MLLISPLASTPLPSGSEVGGKGLSLMRMKHAGLAVPDGFVLRTAFFEPWLDALRATPAWVALRAADGSDAALRSACDALKRSATSLTLDDGQRAALDAALAAHATTALFAVRSSSPEEDLSGASFAGGYETVLGVTRAALEDALRRTFTSCLDARVALYKRAHGLDPSEPRIAVVVQEQVRSEIAGVGFSLDPLTNAYDLALFNASFGLGETVVAGTASPDLFVVDKVTGDVLRRERGAKETSIWLGEEGGTEERPSPRRAEFTLDDAKLRMLTEEIVRVEALYGHPVDIEWAFAGDRLFLLQARPITTHLELPAALVTPPGARKRLYLDVTIAVQGLFEPLSPAGTSAIALLLREASKTAIGHDVTGRVADTVPFAMTGRLYLNLSNVMSIVGKAAIERFLGELDGLAARALREASEDVYRGPWTQRSTRGLLLRLLPRKLLRAADGIRDPAAARAAAVRSTTEVVAALREARADVTTPLDVLAQTMFARAARCVFEAVLPRFLATKIAMRAIEGLFPDASSETRARIALLDTALEGNVTVEMGLALADAAALLPAGVDAEALASQLKSGAAPAAFAEAWARFIDRYGHRGPRELDMAAPRYREEPRMLLRQAVQQRSMGTEVDGGARRRAGDARRAAVAALTEEARKHGRLRAAAFVRLARTIELLGGLRETPKFVLITAIDVLRTRMMRAADALVAQGRLDDPSQVWDLWIDDVAEGERDPFVDLRARARARRAEHGPFERARELPRVFDSRGQIFRGPSAPLAPGELSGQPISNGVVRGRCRVLHTADESELAPGEILVARATDPGWTPLFVNAAGVVLEVGGLMQHGALVAREYGKPCVAGVERATERLRDGLLVELDGTAGIIRLLDEAMPPPVNGEPAPRMMPDGRGAPA